VRAVLICCCHCYADWSPWADRIVPPIVLVGHANGSCFCVLLLPLVTSSRIFSSVVDLPNFHPPIAATPLTAVRNP